MKRLLDYDPDMGIKIFHEYDSQTKVTTITTEQDVTGIIEFNKRQLYDEDSRKGIKRSWWKVASIPVTIIHKWLIEDGIDVFNKDHRKAVLKKLNDPDWRYLRTSRGRL